LQRQGRFISPTSRHILDCIPPSPQNQEGDIKRANKVDTFAVRDNRQVEPSEAVTSETICAALNDDTCGAVGDEDGLDDGFKEGDVRVVVDAVAEGDIETVVFSLLGADFVVVSCAGEEVLWVVLVEGEGEDAVGGEEGFLDAVAVVQVNVNV
jgi:hypothetical protein